MKTNYYFDYINEEAKDNAILRRLESDNIEFFPEYDNRVAPLLSIEYDDIKAMSRDERNALRTQCYDILESLLATRPEWSIAYRVEVMLYNIEQKEFFEASYDDFKEFESHMGEPDFDWGLYSDWHKDLFGFRPRR